MNQIWLMLFAAAAATAEPLNFEFQGLAIGQTREELRSYNAPAWRHWKRPTALNGEPSYWDLIKMDTDAAAEPLAETVIVIFHSNKVSRITAKSPQLIDAVATLNWATAAKKIISKTQSQPPEEPKEMEDISGARLKTTLKTKAQLDTAKWPNAKVTMHRKPPSSTQQKDTNQYWGEFTVRTEPTKEPN